RIPKKKPRLLRACNPEIRMYMNLRWMPANDRILATAIGTSIVLHAVVLAVHFNFPVAPRSQNAEQRMDVVLVNARTRERPPHAKSTPAEQAAPQPTGRDLADLALAAMRLQAQIDKQIDDYQKRPRKKFIGANAAEYRFAQYEEEWRAKVERVGTVNYPAEARGKLYGNLRMTVTIRPDGSVDSVELDRSSGLKVLDAAAFRIVRMAAPYATFPGSIDRDTDLLVITRTWFFSQGDKIWTQ